MAKRKNSLLEKARAAPPMRLGKPPWYVRMEEDEPEKFAEIKELVTAWIAGEFQLQFPSMSSLFVFLEQEGMFNGQIEAQTFRQWIKHLKTESRKQV